MADWWLKGWGLSLSSVDSQVIISFIKEAPFKESTTNCKPFPDFFCMRILRHITFISKFALCEVSPTATTYKNAWTCNLVTWEPWTPWQLWGRNIIVKLVVPYYRASNTWSQQRPVWERDHIRPPFGCIYIDASHVSAYVYHVHLHKYYEHIHVGNWYLCM